jgi:hypothetical protein
VDDLTAAAVDPAALPFSVADRRATAGRRLWCWLRQNAKTPMTVTERHQHHRPRDRRSNIARWWHHLSRHAGMTMDFRRSPALSQTICRLERDGDAAGDAQ